MDYATQPFVGERKAVVIPLGDIAVAPAGVTIVRDEVVAHPFAPGEVDDSAMLFDD